MSIWAVTGDSVNGLLCTGNPALIIDSNAGGATGAGNITRNRPGGMLGGKGVSRVNHIAEFVSPAVIHEVIGQVKRSRRHSALCRSPGRCGCEIRCWRQVMLAFSCTDRGSSPGVESG